MVRSVCGFHLDEELDLIAHHSLESSHVQLPRRVAEGLQGQTLVKGCDTQAADSRIDTQAALR